MRLLQRVRLSLRALARRRVPVCARGACVPVRRLLGGPCSLMHEVGSEAAAAGLRSTQAGSVLVGTRQVREHLRSMQGKL